MKKYDVFRSKREPRPFGMKDIPIKLGIFVTLTILVLIPIAFRVAGAEGQKKLPILPPMPRLETCFAGLQVTIPDSRKFILLLGDKKTRPKAEIRVEIDGKRREFTLEEFKLRLGFSEPRGIELLGRKLLDNGK